MEKNMLMGFWALMAGYCAIRMWVRYEEGNYAWAIVMALTACVFLARFAQLNREDR